MDINLGKNFGGNIGVMPETAGTGVENVGHAVADESEVSRSASNLTIGEHAIDISSSEPTADVPEDALRRDDDLGKFVSAAFNLPPPPMPDFAAGM